jgi:hypothetical protein
MEPSVDINIESFKTFSCRVNIDSPQEILGNTPVATKYMRAKARYDYMIEETTHIKVKKDGSSSKASTNAPPCIRSGLRKEQGMTNTLNYIFSEYYASIKKWTDEYGVNAVTPCQIMGHIAVESCGERNAKGGSGEFGLMQIMPATWQEIENDTQVFTDDTFDPDTNIRFGTYYISKIYKSWSQLTDAEQRMQFAIASYNAGTGNIQNSCCPGGACMTWNECVASGNLPEISQEVTTHYVPNVLEYKKVCEELQFDNFAVIEEPTNADVKTLTIAKTQIDGTGMYTTTLDGTRLSLLLREQKDKYTAGLHYSKNELYSNLPLEANKTVFDSRFPFVRYRMDGANIIVEYMGGSIADVGRLEGDLKTTSGEVVKTDVWKGWVQVYYDEAYGNIVGDDEIELYDADGKRFCEIEWPSYIAYGICEDVPGVIVRNKETVKENVVDDPSAVMRRGYTTIQVEYDPDYSAPCCSAPSPYTCQCSNFDCGTCTEDQCSQKDTGGEWVCSAKS